MIKNLIALVLFITSFQSLAQGILDQNNLTAWCIVPFDKMERSPKERIAMLKDLNFDQYVYDWRSQHLASFKQEIEEARNSEIDIEGVWLWADDNSDKVGELSADNLKLLEILKETNLETTIWVGFNYNFFEGLSHKQKVAKGASFLFYLQSLLKPLGCDIALYNHGDWFGEPENQIEIIKATGSDDIGIVYSFHHGHHQFNRFHSMLKTMLPYLVAVNLDGMDLDKGQILPIGSGIHEKEMIQMILESGFEGRIGILGHNDQEDVKKVLQANLAGLQKLKSEF